MDEDLTGPLVRVRTDTRAFARDVAAMRAELDGPLQAGAERSGRAIDRTLARAIQSGKLGFEDLKRTALSVLGQIAAAAVMRGLGALTGAGWGLGMGGLLTRLLGAPGRATGGPVTGERPYWVGERGPELFVPTASGRIEPAGGSAGGRSVTVAIRVQAEAGTAPEALRRSSRQVARAVRAAILEGE